MELSDEVKAMIEKRAGEIYTSGTFGYADYKTNVTAVLSDPELLSKVGYVKKEEWISVEDRLPEVGQNVLIRYYKHKKSNFSGNTGIFIIQAYYLEQKHHNFNNELLYVEKCWYDYTDRKIWDIKSASKNKVIEWQPLPSPPQK